MSVDSEDKQDDGTMGKGDDDASKVFFLLSPDWKAAATEGQKIFLIVFSALYVTSLITLCYILIRDSNMAHSLNLKAFINKRLDAPILQKINMDARVIFTPGSWYRLSKVVLEPKLDGDGRQGQYPVIRETLTNAIFLYERCLTMNFRTSPILDIANVCLVIGSVVFVFSGPLIILSRQAFYDYSLIGSILLAAWILLVRAAAGCLYDCLLTTQTVQIDDRGTRKEKLYNGTLFEPMLHPGLAVTEGLGWYLALIGFTPMIVMSCVGSKVLGRAV